MVMKTKDIQPNIELNKFVEWLRRVRDESEEAEAFTHEQMIAMFCHGMGHHLCRAIVDEVMA